MTRKLCEKCGGAGELVVMNERLQEIKERKFDLESVSLDDIEFLIKQVERLQAELYRVINLDNSLLKRRKDSIEVLEKALHEISSLGFCMDSECNKHYIARHALETNEKLNNAFMRNEI